MKLGRSGTMTDDYKRNGFLRQIDRETPPELDLHLVVDNHATHKHPVVCRWLKRHPRFHIHFIPTSSSWSNVVEGFFAQLTNRRLRRGVSHSVPDLVAAIESYVARHKEAPKPFVWTASAEAILDKIGRARAALDGIRKEQSGSHH